MKLKERTILFLNCPHPIIYDGLIRHPDGTLYCVPCQDVKDIVDVATEIRVTCKSCRYGRGCGQNKIEANGKYVRHAGKNPSHDVYLHRGQEILAHHRPQTERLPF